MSYKRITTAQKGKKDARISALKSWAPLIESIIESLAGTRGSRYKTKIASLDSALRTLRTSLLPASSAPALYSPSRRNAEDPRVKTLRSWAQMAKELLPRFKKTASSVHSKAVMSIGEELKKLYTHVRRIPGVNIQHPPAPATTNVSRQVEDSPSEAEASPTVIMLEKKKGLFRNPELFQFELWDDRKTRYAATPALGRGPLFSMDANKTTKSSSCRNYPTKNMQQYKTQKNNQKRLLVAGGSRLSFGREIETAKEKFNLLDPNAHVLLIKTQENYEKPLKSYGQPLQMLLPIVRLAASSSLLRNLLLDKHSGTFKDECDMVIYDPEKTVGRKEYVHQITIYAQGLLFDEEVQRRSDNKCWQQLEEDEFWWGFEVYGRWVITTHVVLEGDGGVKARGKGAVLTARYLGFDQDEEYWKALECVVG